MSSTPFRRSTRQRRAKAKGPQTDGTTLQSESDGSANQQPQPRPSKQHATHQPGHTTRGTVARKAFGSMRGSLANLPQMPIDILFEIFKLLTPLDLLHLSRTSGDLRSTLMGRSSLTVWKGARANVPTLPECPKGISEPSYANFIFTSNCCICLTPRISHTLAPHFMRFCKECGEDKFLWSPSSATLPEMLQELPVSVHPHAYRLMREPGHSEPAWLLSDLDTLYERYSQVRNDTDRREEFIKTQTEVVQTMSEWQDTYSRWISNKRQSRFDELVRTRMQRADAIRARLTQAGWGEILESLTYEEECEFDRLPAVRQSKPFTDRIWKNIEPEMTFLMRKFSSNRLQKGS